MRCCNTQEEGMGADLLRDCRVAHARHGCKSADQCHPQHEHEAPHQRPASMKQGSTTPTVEKNGPVRGCSETQASIFLLCRSPLRTCLLLQRAACTRLCQQGVASWESYRQKSWTCCCLRATILSPAPEAQHAAHGLYERAHDFAAQHLPHAHALQPQPPNDQRQALKGVWRLAAAWPAK